MDSACVRTPTRVGYDLLNRQRNHFYCLLFGLFGFCNFVSAKFLCRPVPSTASTKQADNEVGFSCLAGYNNDVALFIWFIWYSKYICMYLLTQSSLCTYIC